MYKIWEKKTQQEIKEKVFGALKKNINYDEQMAFGIPASSLDGKVFSRDEAFIKDAPFISTLVENPNHIGCHTLNRSESYFEGTQAIERELIELCATDILQGRLDSHDGYVASGGTEANLQAIWIYRNYFISEFDAKLDEICILCTVDSHYSMDKAGDIFVLDVVKISVDDDTRKASKSEIEKSISLAKRGGKKYFIVVCNMMTTMFGSVDSVEDFTSTLLRHRCVFKVHVDAAFGGFYYPFTEKSSSLNFKNPLISSFTLDAHKMAQAPYGTGIFIIRKGFMNYSTTRQASYVEGEDCTLIGSRSGANAVATWMILMKNGPFGWQEKIFILQKRTDWLCEKLTDLKVSFYRSPHSNIVAIRSAFIQRSTAEQFGLVPDNHASPSWYKIVVMEHVTIEKMAHLLDEQIEHQN